MVAYKKPQQRMKEESDRLTRERDKTKFTKLKQILGVRSLIEKLQAANTRIMYMEAIERQLFARLNGNLHRD